MRIRKIKETDIGNIVRIVHKIMGPNDAKMVLYDLRETLLKKINSPFKFEDFYVIEIDRDIVGAGGIWALKHDPSVARLDWFMIDPDYQRKGIGTILIRFLENFLKKKNIKLILAETSSGRAYRAAVNFWAKNGFKEIAKIPNYWEDGSACLYFVKRL
jgi:ribosomal protein S18 acetylase RimI-like enzyme